MKILLFGPYGQVGWELQRCLQSLGELRIVRRDECDMADTAALRRCVHAEVPALIVNAAAYTDVDRAESEPYACDALNATAPTVLADAAAQIGASLVHYSTDYVFDGASEQCYAESDTPNPLSRYGSSKLAGERGIQGSGAAHLILRTSWVYSSRRSNFLRTMIRLMRERTEVSVVSDQRGTPTWARLIAEVTAIIVARAGTTAGDLQRSFASRGGIFHLVPEGAASRFEFAEFIGSMTVDSHRRMRVLRAIRSDEHSMVASRPLNAVLSNERLSQAWSVHLPHWRDSLRLCLADGVDGVELGVASN